MDNNTNENNKYDDFESGEIFLSLAKSEYDNEHTRTQVIDTYRIWGFVAYCSNYINSILIHTGTFINNMAYACYKYSYI